MAFKKGNKERAPIFYGWYILAASFFILFFNSGARVSIGVLFKPMITEFGWSRSSISLAFFLNMTLFALSLPLIGRFYDRYGPKWIIIISTIFISLGFICMSFTSSLWQFLIFYGVIAAVGMGGTAGPIFSAITTKWFVKRRGFAISVALSGNSIGQFALVPLFTIFILWYGWRISSLLIGIVMLIVNIALTIWIIKGDPDSLGMEPYGASEKNSLQDLNPEHSSLVSSEDLGLREAMRTKSFWLYAIVMLICGSADFFVTTHLIPLATDHGISQATAGNMLAWFGLTSLGGVLIAGPISDMIGNKVPISLTFLLRAILFIMILKFKTLLSFYIFSLLFGLTFLVTAPLTPMLIGRLYGLTHVGVLAGFITTIHHLAGGFWAYMGGVVFDRTGNYQIIFFASTILAIIAFLCSLFIKEKRHSRVNPNVA